VRDVFERVLALPAAERGAYLALACGGNEAQRKQVEGMIESHGRAPGFLDTPAAALLDETMAVRSLAGQRIGPYQLSSRIGAGGMGEVYKAIDTRLDRTVAVKVLPAHVANDPQALERFDREGRAIAALNHPHICALHDVGEATIPSHQPSAISHYVVRFLVMELLEGETLAARWHEDRCRWRKRCTTPRRSHPRSRRLTAPASCTVI